MSVDLGREKMAEEDWKMAARKKDKESGYVWREMAHQRRALVAGLPAPVTSSWPSVRGANALF